MYFLKSIINHDRNAAKMIKVTNLESNEIKLLKLVLRKLMTLKIYNS